MPKPSADFNRFLKALSVQLGISLALRDGVCALYDSQGQEAAVIELPEHSEMVVFHCRVGRSTGRVAELQRLLSLNFEVTRLHGCWFALDQTDVRLCAQRDLEALDEAAFCNVALGFIAQAGEARKLMQA
jgi:uncharacterized protein YecT (DUF1311 family)